MAVSNDNIPPNAVQVLFAEDFIKSFLDRLNGILYETWRAGPYRDFILNGFNMNVQIAVDFIEKSLEDEIYGEYSKFADSGEVNCKSFVDYCLHYEQFYFHEGFAADCFLYYCARLGSMAAYFVRHDVQEAVDLTVHFISKVLEGHDMFAGGWDTLNAVAEKYVKIDDDFLNVLTPKASDDESDDELSLGSSEDLDGSM